MNKKNIFLTSILVVCLQISVGVSAKEIQSDLTQEEMEIIEMLDFLENMDVLEESIDLLESLDDLNLMDGKKEIVERD